jgi:hypothetical protein
VNKSATGRHLSDSAPIGTISAVALQEVDMWFRWFVLLRLPISVVMLLGLGTASGERWTSVFGAVCAVAALAFLGAVSIKLFRRRRGALPLAGWLLALELVGAVLLVGSGDYMVARHVDVGALFVCGCAVGLLWTLPNGLVLHSQHGRFTER